MNRKQLAGRVSPPYSHEGNTEKNNGYVVFKWNIHGSAGKYRVGWGLASLFRPPTHATFCGRLLLDCYLKTTWTVFPPPRILLNGFFFGGGGGGSRNGRICAFWARICNRLRSPGIDSKESISSNRFLCSLNVSCRFKCILLRTFLIERGCELSRVI